jgi:hypothetical protein
MARMVERGGDAPLLHYRWRVGICTTSRSPKRNLPAGKIAGRLVVRGSGSRAAAMAVSPTSQPGVLEYATSCEGCKGGRGRRPGRAVRQDAIGSLSFRQAGGDFQEMSAEGKIAWSLECMLRSMSVCPMSEKERLPALPAGFLPAV